MFKYVILLIGAMAGFLLPGQAQETIDIQPLDMERDDVGCDFLLRSSRWDNKPIDPSSPEQTTIYRAGDITVELHYGRGKAMEAGSLYKRARIIVKTPNAQKTVKAKAVVVADSRTNNRRH
jgi:hypothetical protein